MYTLPCLLTEDPIGRIRVFMTAQKMYGVLLLPLLTVEEPLLFFGIFNSTFLPSKEMYSAVTVQTMARIGIRSRLPPPQLVK